MCQSCPSPLCRAIALLLKRIESIFRQPDELRPAHLQVMRLDDSVVHRLRQQFDPDFLLVRGAVRADEAAFAGERLDDALALQFRLGFGDGVAVDAQFLGEWPDGG